MKELLTMVAAVAIGSISPEIGPVAARKHTKTFRRPNPLKVRRDAAH